MKTGQLVYVCHDGKIGRRIEGTVVSVKPYKIQVTFTHRSGHGPDYKTITAWFKRESTNYGTRGKKAYYSGWVDIDWHMPWFRVYDKKVIDNYYKE